jgi:hypothetical protein
LFLHGNGRALLKEESAPFRMRVPCGRQRNYLEALSHYGGAPDGPVIGRIYKQAFSPSGTPWFWGLLIYPAMAADRGTEETREAAMAALKARWVQRVAG